MYIPEKIKVGFQERQGTYSGKLAYVIYYDEKNILRKAKSWEGWRDKQIEPLDLENKPTEGFVLNKKVGGYDTGWNHRQTYTRVYDPRGFEFEINIENLLFILENCTSTKGKGLEGKFVYSWTGKDLVLLPCDSPDYVEIQELTTKIKNKKTIKGKDLIPGYTYLTKTGNKLVYIDRREQYNIYKKAKKEYVFYQLGLEGGYRIPLIAYTSPGNIIECIGNEYMDKCPLMLGLVDNDDDYNKIDETKNEYKKITAEEMYNTYNYYYNDKNFYYAKHFLKNLIYGEMDAENNDSDFIPIDFKEADHNYHQEKLKEISLDQFKEIVREYKPKYLHKTYFENGNLYEKQEIKTAKSIYSSAFNIIKEHYKTQQEIIKNIGV